MLYIRKYRQPDRDINACVRNVVNKANRYFCENRHLQLVTVNSRVGSLMPKETRWMGSSRTRCRGRQVKESRG